MDIRLNQMCHATTGKISIFIYSLEVSFAMVEQVLKISTGTQIPAHPTPAASA
jgi:hypothetical protein